MAFVVLVAGIMREGQRLGVRILFPVDQLFDPFQSKRLESKRWVGGCSVEGLTVEQIHKHLVGNPLFKDVGFVELVFTVGECEGAGFVPQHGRLHVMVGIPQVSQGVVKRCLQPKGGDIQFHVHVVGQQMTIHGSVQEISGFVEVDPDENP